MGLQVLAVVLVLKVKLVTVNRQAQGLRKPTEPIRVV
jgi:hypothetical protein